MCVSGMLGMHQNALVNLFCAKLGNIGKIPKTSALQPVEIDFTFWKIKFHLFQKNISHQCVDVTFLDCSNFSMVPLKGPPMDSFSKLVEFAAKKEHICFDIVVTKNVSTQQAQSIQIFIKT